MIDDIVFGGILSINPSEFILETPMIIDGNILSYSLDGSNYDFVSGESVSIIII